jgi:hypothetical protein
MLAAWLARVKQKKRRGQDGGTGRIRSKSWVSAKECARDPSPAGESAGLQDDHGLSLIFVRQKKALHLARAVN